MKCSIGIMAYNEEANIGKLLQALGHQKISCCQLQEIVVVASGCTDKTAAIATVHAARNPRVTVLIQQHREGKASAINLFLQHARSADLLVLESADTLPAGEYTLDALLQPLVERPEVGMTGAHPVPLDPSDHFLGFVVNLQWNLHHRIALKSPKLGELVAFKNLLPAIPADTAVDEACIEALIEPKGYVLVYVPDALVYNKGPDTLADFVKQRRRIAAGHHHLRCTQRYAVATQSFLPILSALFYELGWSPKRFSWIIGAITLELYSRWLGIFDFYIKKKNPFTWDVATTTKKLRNQL